MSTANVTAKFGLFKLVASYLGNKEAPWSKEDDKYSNSNNHRITVTHTETGKRTSFEFWASIANPEIRKPKEVIEAFQCFVSDAVSGLDSFDDFCATFGYDSDSRRAERTWKACANAAKKLKNILPPYPGDSSVYVLSHELNEWEDAQ